MFQGILNTQINEKSHKAFDLYAVFRLLNAGIQGKGASAAVISGQLSVVGNRLLPA